MLIYLAVTCCVSCLAAFPSPPGQYINLTKEDLSRADSYGINEPLVGTYFFYWYNIHTKEHFINPDGSDALVDHPANTEDYSYDSSDWWKRELQDVKAARIDFIAPVYWGVPGYESWSFEGLPKLVEAWDELDKADESPPRVGLFYDTSTLSHNPQQIHVDLTTPEGKEWLYNTIRDYYSLIPPRMWAMVDESPVIFLYSAAFAAKQDPAALNYVYSEFEKDFACRPYIVKEISWQGDADATYAWGGALGPRWNDVVALGPGYDHHAVPGRKPLVVDREGGQFYARAWEMLLAQSPKRRANMVMVETWNELHEGTDICHTVEYGRKYIEMTAKYAGMFKEDIQLTPDGPYSEADHVYWDSVEGENGLSIPISGDGLIEQIKIDDIPAVHTRSNPYGGRYLYVKIDDSFLFDQEIPVEIELTYLDAGCERIVLQYDSTDPEGSVREGAFKAGGDVSVGETEEWKKAKFKVTDGRFVNRNNGADFRFAVIGGDLTVKRVEVKKL
ncbi:hypothetical protein GF312_21210 [Candidatus Poribacteria bacterium]|nr:hypothetical protein [Candidatus Poribacteria bacterium]